MRIFSGMATFRFRLKGSTEWITGLTLEDKPFTIEPIINKFQVKTDYSQSVYKELLNSVDYAVEMGISMTDSIFLTFNSSKIYEGDLVVMTVEGDLLFRFDDISLTVKQHFDFKKSVTNYIEISGITKNDFVLLDPHVVPESVTFTSVPDTPLNISDTFQLAWTVEPWYAPQQVTFRSSNEGVLTVDENGLVTAITEGTADITVTTINEKTDTTTIECSTSTPVTGDVEFTVLVESDVFEGTRKGYHNDGLGSIVTPDDNLSIVYSFGKDNAGTHTAYIGWDTNAHEGETMDIYIEGELIVSDKEVTYNSSSDIARISESLTEAEAELIYNKFGTLVGGNADVVLVVKSTPSPIEPTSVSFTSSPPTIEPTDTFQLEWEVLPGNADDKSVTFVSSATGVATVDANGLVTGVANGTTTITVETINNKTDTIVVTVETGTPSGDVEFTITVAIDTEASATRAGYHEDGLGTLVTADPNVNIVYSFGKDIHTAYIGWDGQSYKEHILDVYIDDELIVSDVETTYISETDITRISENLSEAEADAIYNKFNSLVGSNAVVKLMDKGAVTPVEPTSVAFTNTPPTMNPSGTFQATWEVLPENANDKSVTFSSSDTGVATVDSVGLITAIANGTSTITIETVNGKTDIVDVTVIDAPTINVYEISVEASTYWGVQIYEFYRNGNHSDAFSSISTTIDITNEENAIDGSSETYAEDEEGSDGWLLKAKYETSTVSDFSVDLLIPTNAPITIKWFKNGTEVHEEAEMGSGSRETFTFNM
jgi:uncharacterized protein YjdB